MVKKHIYIVLLYFLVSPLLLSNLDAQCINNGVKTFDKYKDTLLIIKDNPIVSERIIMTREELVSADTFSINQKGLVIMGFTVSSIALGKSFELKTDKPFLSKAMKDEILNSETKYKFIYIKNINLQTVDGRIVNPSLNKIKIIFSN